MDINVLGTLNVLEACKEVTPEMIVVASTAAVYGISDFPCKETEQPAPLDIYGISKYSCELLAQQYTRDTGGPCIAARIFNAVGPNETNPHLIPQLLNQIISGERIVSLGNLEPLRDYIHTSDLARGLICALNHKQDGYDVFNIGTGIEHSVMEIVKTCEQIINERIEVKQNSKLIRKVDRMHLCANIEKIKGMLHWKPSLDIYHTLKDLLDSGVIIPINEWK
jgi:UDP-glucose 4-epimerase